MGVSLYPGISTPAGISLGTGISGLGGISGIAGGSFARTVATNRNEINTSVVTQNYNTRASRLKIYTPINQAMSQLKIEHANYYPTTQTGPEIANSPAFILSASIEYPIGTFNRFTWNGSYTIMVNAGDNPVSDPLKLTIPAGTKAYVITNAYIAGDVSGGYNGLQNQQFQASSDSHEGYAQDNSSIDYSTGAGTFTVPSGFNQVYGHLKITGIPSSVGPSVLILGDSISRQTGGTHSPPNGLAGGDFYNGISPTAPWVNYGNYNWIEIGLGITIPYYNMGQPSKQSSQFSLPANNINQLAAADRSPPTHVILETAVNDFTNGANSSQILNYDAQILAWVKARWGSKVFRTTCTPRTTSTDSFITKANQAFTGLGSNAVAFSDTGGGGGRIDYNAATRANQVGFDGIIDVSALVEDQTDNRYWRTDSMPPQSINNAWTFDGTHISVFASVYVGPNAIVPSMFSLNAIQLQDNLGYMSLEDNLGKILEEN